MAEEVRQQVPVIKEVLEAMNISTIEKAGLEADDLEASVSRVKEESEMIYRLHIRDEIHCTCT